MTEVHEGSPAAKSGLRMHDKILQCNGYDFTMVTHKKAVGYIRKHPVLNLLVARKGVTSTWGLLLPLRISIDCYSLISSRLLSSRLVNNKLTKLHKISLYNKKKNQAALYYMPCIKDDQSNRARDRRDRHIRSTITKRFILYHKKQEKSKPEETFLVTLRRHDIPIIMPLPQHFQPNYIILS